MSLSKKATKRQIVLAVGIAIFLAFFVWGRTVDAAEVGLGLGTGLPSTHSDGIRAQEIQIRTNDYRWYFSYARIGANINGRLQTRQVDRWAIGYTVVWRRGKAVQPYMSIGAAYFDQPPMDLISERLTYDMRVGIRFKDIIELELDNHNSTASRSDKNTGIDIPWVRVVFQF